MNSRALTRRSTLAALAVTPFASALLAQGSLTEKTVRVSGRRISYLVRDTDSGQKRPMLLCFGGGDANQGIMEYYDQVYTPEAVYTDHHIVLPIGPKRQRFFQFSDRDARAMVAALTEAESIEGRSLISGVSNGGRAAFRFAQAAPEAFRGIVTMPGAMGGRIVPAAWKDYAILLACGSEDSRWQAESQRAYSVLQGKVGALELVTLAGQGHVVHEGFDIDPVYARLMALETALGR